MVTLNLTEEQFAYLGAALDKAMDNEPDGEYYDAFGELRDLVRLTRSSKDAIINT
jgi:hypothetical protein